MIIPQRLWLTPIQRANLDFAARLGAGKPLPEGFIRDLLKNRDAEIDAANRYSGYSALLVLVVAFVSSEALVDVSAFGVQAKNIKLVPEMMLFFASVLFAFAVIRMINSIFASGMALIAEQHETADVTSIYHANISARDLWASVIKIRTVGYRSGLAHKIVALSLALLIIVLTISLAVFGLISVFLFARASVQTNGWFSASGVVSCCSVAIVVTSIVGFLVASFARLPFDLATDRR
ncbi:hypothetical protein JNW90_23670 [Micromonospora sp. STR1s_5]|nr:hypothetical protein [Micromonospora sp. STR1s_5]